MADMDHLLAFSAETSAHIAVDADGIVYAQHGDGTSTRLQAVQGPEFDVASYAPAGTARDGFVDWTTYIEQALTDALAVNSSNVGRQSGVVKLPPGRYKISRPLRIMGSLSAQNVWNFCSVTIEGDSKSYGNAFNASSIEPDFLDGPAIVIQGAKSVTLRNLAIVGKNVFATGSPAWADPIAAHYDDDNYLAAGARFNRYSPHAGVAIDPFHEDVTTDDRYPALTDYYVNTGTGGGSSEVLIENCSIYYFVAGIVVTPQPAGAMQNAELFTFRNLRVIECRDCLAVGQEQSRTLNIENGVWGLCRSVFNGVDYGAGRGQPPNIRGAQAGSCKFFCKVTPGWTAQVEVSGVYAENLLSLGFPSRMHFSGCEFHFPATPSGKPAIPRIVHFGHNSFSGVHFFTSSNAEPQWHIPTNYARVGYSDCSFTTAGAQQDSSPRHWFAGLRHLVEHDRCKDTVTPWGCYLGPRWQIDFLSNLYNYALQPGTTYSATSGTEVMRALDTQWPGTVLGTLSTTIYADGHATFAGSNLDQTVAVGDIIETTTTYDASVWEAQSVSPIVNTTVLGKVTAVTATEVTVDFVPFFMCPASGSATANHTLTARWLPRVHEPATGDVNFNGDMTQVTSVSPNPVTNSRWQVGDRIRDKQGRISAGTYVKAVSGTTITLSKAAAGGAGTETLDLYGATVYALDRTAL